MPEELREVEPAKRSAVVAEKSAEREQLQKQLLALSTEREKFVAQQMKQPAAAAKTLDKAVTSAVREQAAKKAFVFEGK